MNGLRQLLRRLRRRPPANVEDEAARQEAKRIRDDVETERLGALEGPPLYTHGGEESRRG